ncbi:DUF4129 domain-containing protein [Candidatus Sumerlaeota bacterium]|nr:DUF4129 domain-containing protein [Candidatus Sumerlaeota bacterium]
MGQVRKHSAIYHSPYALALYFWAFWLSGLTLHVALLPQLNYDPQLTGTLLWGVLTALFLLTYSARVTLIDLFRGMNYRERFGGFLVIVTFALAPLVISSRASLLLCLCSMHLPLLALLSGARSFARMYMNTLLILILYGIEKYQHPYEMLQFYGLAGALLTLCFVMDFYTFRAESFGQLERVRLWRAHLLAAGFYSSALFIAGMIFWAQPEFNQGPVPGRTIVERPTMQGIIEGSSGRPLPQVTQKEMTEILVYTLALMGTLMLFIVVLYAMRRRRWRKMSQRRTHETIGETHGLLMARSKREERRRSRRAPHSPREAMMRTYAKFCDWTAARYRARQTGETAREYNLQAASAIPALGADIDAVTLPFESAKYSAEEFGWDDAERYEQTLDDLLKSTGEA